MANVSAHPFKKPCASEWLSGGGETEEIPVCSKCGERRTSCEKCSGEKQDGE